MKKTHIIAEIAQGYEGDIKLCERFVKLAKKCGADGVKFQIFEAEEICLPNYKHYDLFQSLYISPEKWSKIIALCNELDIDFYADVLGTKTLNWISKCKITGLKIHSSDLKNYSFLSKLRDRNYKLLIGAGGSTLVEIEKAVEYLGKDNIVIMSGFQAEPNLIHDIELNKISIIKHKFNVEVGYADHIDVSNPLCKSLPSMAVLMGASYIEKHLTIERNYLNLEDYISALNCDEFIEMANMIRDIEKFPDPNSTEFLLTEREKTYRKNSKKVILALKKINKGSIIKENDLIMLRTAEDYTELLDIDEIIGKEAIVNIEKDKIIRKEFIR